VPPLRRRAPRPGSLRPRFHKRCPPAAPFAAELARLASIPLDADAADAGERWKDDLATRYAAVRGLAAYDDAITAYGRWQERLFAAHPELRPRPVSLSVAEIAGTLARGLASLGPSGARSAAHRRCC